MSFIKKKEIHIYEFAAFYLRNRVLQKQFFINMKYISSTEKNNYKADIKVNLMYTNVCSTRNCDLKCIFFFFWYCFNIFNFAILYSINSPRILFRYFSKPWNKDWEINWKIGSLLRHFHSQCTQTRKIIGKSWMVEITDAADKCFLFICMSVCMYVPTYIHFLNAYLNIFLHYSLNFKYSNWLKKSTSMLLLFMHTSH